MEKPLMAGKPTKRIFFQGLSFYVFDDVYEPAEDTFLLAENLEVKPSDVVLEVGTGCGILAVLSAIIAEQVVALDINPYAVRCAKLNAKCNNLSEKIDIVRGDLFGPLRKGLFDLILFNAPYLPTEKDNPKEWIDYAWSGGEKGRELIDRFICLVSQYLKPDGRVLLVQSTLSNVEQTLKELKRRRFEVKIVGKHKAAFETITLIEAKRAPKKGKKPSETFGI